MADLRSLAKGRRSVGLAMPKLEDAELAGTLTRTLTLALILALALTLPLTQALTLTRQRARRRVHADRDRGRLGQGPRGRGPDCGGPADLWRLPGTRQAAQRAPDV